MTQQTPASTLQTPSADGDVLVFPSTGQVLEHVREAARTLAVSAKPFLQGVPLYELRARARQLVGQPVEQPLVLTGHQIEFFHPGVWCKQVAADAIARAVDGRAWLLAVDSDVPRNLDLRWPDGAASICDAAALRDAPWLAALPMPSAERLAAFSAALAAAAKTWPFASLLPTFADALRLNTPAGGNLAAVLSSAMRLIDLSLGLSYQPVMASNVWDSLPFLLLAHDILARALSFAAAYNRALDEYRDRRGIHSDGRPWPDLAFTPDTCEVPFWLDDMGAGSRRRAMLHRGRGGWELRIGDDAFTFTQFSRGWAVAEKLSRFLGQHNCRLAPRALVLSMYCRMVLSDLFIHGIGGAVYDKVTDRVIELWYAIRPPAPAIISATLYFPTAESQQRIDRHALQVQERRRRHGWSDPHKRELVDGIAATPRLAPRRAQLFAEMHHHLRNATDNDDYRRFKADADAQRRLSDAQRAIFDRQIFYLIQPRTRLQKLIDSTRAAFAPSRGTR
ncbi:MAG: hypothetical protein ACHRHE_06330 [Tepidisphaerales bacterium]